MSGGLQQVHVRVNDAATGQPTHVRIRLTGPDGEYYPPYGRQNEFPTGRNQAVGGNLMLGTRPWAYIDGGCEVLLPPGPIFVDILKGPEYQPLRQEVRLAPGQLALRFTVQRWAHWHADGWYAGDTRTHFLTPHAALLEGLAEGVAVVNLLAVECPVTDSFGKTYPSVPNLLAFSGQEPALAWGGHLVVVNTQNCHPVLGSLGLLNCHRVVFPLSFGGAGGRDDWTMAAWCDQCHRKGGLVVWTNTAHECAEFRYGEPLADLILGKVDAFEIDSFEDSPFDTLADWYRLLDCGLAVPLVGGSGKDGNGVALGAMRTYARLQVGEVLTYRNWIEAVRAGRTFVTNGPLLSFTVGEHGPGETVAVSTGPLPVRAEARSTVPFDRLELVLNGVVIRSVPSAGEAPYSARLEEEIAFAEGGWLAARCVGTHLLPQRPAPQRVFAHTNAVRLVRGGEPRVDPTAAAHLLDHLGRMAHWARSAARRATDTQRQQLVDLFQTAHDVLARRAGG